MAEVPIELLVARRTRSGNQGIRVTWRALMRTRKALVSFAVVAMLVLAACVPVPPQEAAGSQPAPGKDPQNATYLIEGQAVTLVDGTAETAAAPGSASKQVTSYFGNEVALDLNADGLMDSAFLLTQNSGGSGTFYYAAAALQTTGGYLGTNAILLGDRIAPQSTFVDPDNPSQFIVSYGTRPADAAMTSQPTEMVSKTFKLQDGLLVEVTAAAT